MNLIRIFAALLAVVVLVGCEQPGSTEESAAGADAGVAEEAAGAAAEEPMEAAELEPATEGEAAAEGEGDEAAEEGEGDEAAEEGEGSGETADDAMDASEMPADADDTMPAMELEEAEATEG